MNSLQLETEIEKMARAMMTRNSEIGKDLIVYLRTQFTLEAVAGLVLVSIERLLWFDTDSIFWTVEHLIPTDVLQEIKKIATGTFYKQLIDKGFIPGHDFSIDASGNLLTNNKAKTAIFCR